MRLVLWKEAVRRSLRRVLSLPSSVDAAQVRLEELDNHMGVTCERVMRRCPNGCGAVVPRGRLKQHAEQECGKRTMTCTACGSVAIWADEEASGDRAISCI